MAKEPLLPGFIFERTQGKNYHLNQNFNVINGFNIPRISSDQLLLDSQLEPMTYRPSQEVQPTYIKNDYDIRYNPLEDFTKNKKFVRKIFTPHYVAHDGKCLSFRGYFKEQVHEYCHEQKHQLLYRKVNIIYYLEDDTMTIIEPPIPNSGYHQGRLVRRGKIPKRNSSEHWHWKDLNIGLDMEAYGIVYHVCSCDAFTREYLSSQGIEVNKSEEIPEGNLSNDAMNNRKDTLCNYNIHGEQIPFSQDKLYKFLQYDRKVLRFYAYWREKDDDASAEIIRYKIYYYLIDDTVEIRESPTRFSPEQFFKRFLRRTKLPKNHERGTANNHAFSYATVDHKDCYQPKDFLIGTYIHVLGRKFFLYDCDDFTRTYFREYLKIEQSAPIEIPVPNSRPQPVIKEIAPHTGIGQPEDTLQSCLSIVPKPPRKNIIHYVENANKYLRYSVKLDSNIEEDKEREFIMQYSLAEGKISIYENRVPNSGFTPGYFLKSALVPKKTISSSSSHKPEYYTPNDFVIGKTIVIFGRKFLITGADLAVLRYMESNHQKFDAEALISVREYLKRKGIVDDVDNDNDASNSLPS